MIKLEAHFFSVLKASEAACLILEVLPSTDLLDQLESLMNQQLDVLLNMVESKHYGTDNLESFIAYSDELKEEALRIKEEI